MRALLTASLVLGLATAAMAQSAGTTTGNNGTSGSGQSITVNPTTPANPSPDQASPDTGTTGSVTGGDMNSNADKNCPDTPQGAQGDASTAAGTMQPNVNDNNCGK